MYVTGQVRSNREDEVKAEVEELTRENTSVTEYRWG